MVEFTQVRNVQNKITNSNWPARWYTVGLCRSYNDAANILKSTLICLFLFMVLSCYLMRYNLSGIDKLQKLTLTWAHHSLSDTAVWKHPLGAINVSSNVFLIVHFLYLQIHKSISCYDWGRSWLPKYISQSISWDGPSSYGFIRMERRLFGTKHNTE